MAFFQALCASLIAISAISAAETPAEPQGALATVRSSLRTPNGLPTLFVGSLLARSALTTAQKGPAPPLRSILGQR